MSTRTLESDFGEAISELSKPPLSNLFRLKSRMLGSLIDATALRRRGWTLVKTGDAESFRWRRSLWFEKRIGPGEDYVVARVATSQVLRPMENGEDGLQGVPEKDEATLLSGEETVRAFLRSVRFHRDAKDGIFRIDIVDGLPDSILSALEADIAACTLQSWPSLFADLEYQTKGLPARMPPNMVETPFTKAMRVLNGRLIGSERPGNLVLVSAERLLVRFVRAAVDPDWDPRATMEVEAYPDGVALSNFVQLWFSSAPDDGASRRFLAYALGQADRLSLPFSAFGWSGLSVLLRREERFREAVLAADRALDRPDADERHASFLWESVLSFLRNRFVGPDGRTGERVELGWLIQILFEREDALGGMDGYSTILRFAINVNQKDGAAVSDAVAKMFASDSGEKPGRAVETVVSSSTSMPESFDAVRAAFHRLRASFGCKEVVLWIPNPDGIDLSARVHGLVLRYRVEKKIGKDRLHIEEGWKPSNVQTLTVRILAADGQYDIEYEGFPLLKPPSKADEAPFFCHDRSARSLGYLLAEGRTGGLDYDGRNIVEMAACRGASFLDRALSRMEQLGVDVNAMAHVGDYDGLCAIEHQEEDLRIVEVLRKHGIVIPPQDSLRVADGADSGRMRGTETKRKDTGKTPCRR